MKSKISIPGELLIFSPTIECIDNIPDIFRIEIQKKHYVKEAIKAMGIYGPLYKAIREQAPTLNILDITPGIVVLRDDDPYFFHNWSLIDFVSVDILEIQSYKLYLTRTTK